MKNLVKIFISGFIIFSLGSCATQNTIAPEQLTSLLNSKEFTFMAERANPTSYDVVNILNSLPNSPSSNILNLDYGYTLVIKKDQVSIDLPYFGRMFTPNFDRDKNGIKFVSKDFKINESLGKKGSSVYTIIMEDQHNINGLVLEVYKSGKAFLSVSANDRQSISYDGYLMPNKPEKK